MIHISHVYKTYPGPVHALRNVDIQIDQGEFVFLLGPSGAGKTTLFKVISAFDRPTSGQIEVAGFNLNKITRSEVPEYRRSIGVVFQDFKLLKNRSVFENVALPLIVRGDRRASIEPRVHEVLDSLGILDKANQFPEFISGGEQQRTAIARAMVHKPLVLIADEPTGNLDHSLGSEIMNLFEKIANQGTTVFIATHDQMLIQGTTKRKVYLKNGSLKEVTNLSEVSI